EQDRFQEVEECQRADDDENGPHHSQGSGIEEPGCRRHGRHDSRSTPGQPRCGRRSAPGGSSRRRYYDDDPTSFAPCARPGCRKRERYRAVRREKMSQALAGIRVIDFTHDQAGPSCTQRLAWLGADVIKIERPPHGDRARRLWATPDDPADSYFFLLLNSNKRSIVVDLKTVEGKDIARRLVGEADVVAEILGPGVMERLGLGYEAVKVLNPRAVYASVKGFGSYGPYSGFQCFEPGA